MIWRTFRGLVQLLGAMGAGFVIIVVLLAWRLSSGPISIDFLTPYIEQALNRRESSFRFALDHTILAWAGWQRAFDVRVVNVRAMRADGSIIARVPELSLAVSARALLRGQVAPSRIELFGSSLRLVREADGTVRFGSGDGAEGSQAIVAELLAELAAPPDETRPLGYLTRFTILDGRLTVEDRSLQTIWLAPSMQIHLTREAKGVAGLASFDLAVGERLARISVQGRYQQAGGRIDVDVGFTDIVPAEFGRLSPALAALAAFDLPVSGSLGIDAVAGAEIGAVSFRLFGGGGALVLPAPFDQRLDVERLEARGRYRADAEVLDIETMRIDAGTGGTLRLPPAAHPFPIRTVRGGGRYLGREKRIEIDELLLDTGGPVASLQATVDDVGGAVTVSGAAKIERVTYAELTARWPAGWAKDARKWVIDNISAGEMRDVHAVFGLHGGGPGGFEIETLKGGMTFEDVVIDYLAPMPKARKGRAIARFDEKHFGFDVVGGEVAGLAVRKGTVVITGLDKHDQYLDLDLTIVGAVADALRLVDSPPLRLAGAVGLDPSRAEGAATTRLKMRFILEHALTFDEVEVRAQSRLTNVAIPEALFRRDVADGRFTLTADKKGMDLKGEAKLAGIPIALAWRENFAKAPAFRRRYEISGSVADIHALGDLGPDIVLPPPSTASGAVAVEARYTDLDGVHGRLDAKMDLRGMRLRIPALAWEKPEDRPGTAEISLALTRDRVSEIERFSLTAPDMAAAGSARYAPNGGLERIAFERLAFGRTDLAGEITSRPGGAWSARFRGPSFDLAPMRDGLFKTGPGEPGPRFDLQLDIDRVWVERDQRLNDLNANLIHDGSVWRTARVKATLGEKKTLDLDMQPIEGDKRRLAVRSNDAGLLLRTLGHYDNMIGGNFALTGELDSPAAGGSLKGVLRVDDYRIIKAPVLTHLLSIMALTGIIDALQGEGLGFSTLEAPFTYGDDVLDISDARATGASIGFTASGKIYTESEVVHLEGTVVPAYLLNAALGKIPVLGAIVTGGEKGSGIFAARYAMTGALKEPKVSVNLLSAVAPGFLRNLFGVPDPDAKSLEPAPGTSPGELGR